MKYINYDIITYTVQREAWLNTLNTDIKSINKDIIMSWKTTSQNSPNGSR